MDKELLGIGLFAIFGFLLFLVLLMCFQKALEPDKVHRIPINMNPESSFIRKLSRSLTAERSAIIMPSILREFSFTQLEVATRKFSRLNLLKAGHSGDLFAGILEGGEPALIKRMQPTKSERDFYAAELDIYGKVSDQRFLVTLLGQCLEDDEKLLVYDYMPNGDLATALANARASMETEDEVTCRSPLSWTTRLKIAEGVAEALAYFHHSSRPRFAHRNIQGSSILLTENYDVKLGSLSEAEKLDGGEFPAYDIYCFGKLLLDLISGLDISGSRDEEAETWIHKCLPLSDRQGRQPQLIEQVVDPSLGLLEEEQLQQVIEVALLAKSCMDPSTLQRLTMKRVLQMLRNL